MVRVGDEYRAGRDLLDLDAKRAPVTVRNFVRYAEQRKFDGIVFYRVMRLNWGEQPNGLIQAGTRGDPRRELPPIAHEPTSQTGVLHKAGRDLDGALGAGHRQGRLLDPAVRHARARRRPDSDNRSCKAGFAAFGHVSRGWMWCAGSMTCRFRRRPAKG